MYLIKVPKCPRVKSMMIVWLEFLGHGVIRTTTTPGDGEVSSWSSGQRDGSSAACPCKLDSYHTDTYSHISIDMIVLHLAFLNILQYLTLLPYSQVVFVLTLGGGETIGFLTFGITRRAYDITFRWPRVVIPSYSRRCHVWNCTDRSKNLIILSMVRT